MESPHHSNSVSEEIIVEKYSVNCIHMTKDDISNYLLVQSLLLFHNYVLRCLYYIIFK